MPPAGSSIRQIRSASPLPPTLTSIDIYYGSRTGGTVVTVTGTHLDNAVSLTIGGLACTVLSSTSTTATGTTPDFAAGGQADAAKNVVVTTASGTATLISAFFTWTPADVASFTVILLPPDILHSGAVVTGWTNRGTAGTWTTVTTGGSPVYTAAEATLNNRPTMQMTAASSQYLMLEKSNVAVSSQIERFMGVSAPTPSGQTMASHSNSAAPTDYQSVLGDILYFSDATHAETYRNASYGNVAGVSANVALAFSSRWATNGANDQNKTRINGTDSAGVDKAGHTNFDIDRIIFGGRWITSSVNTFSTYKISLYLLSDGALSSGDRTITLNFVGFIYGITA